LAAEVEDERQNQSRGRDRDFVGSRGVSDLSVVGELNEQNILANDPGGDNPGGHLPLPSGERDRDGAAVGGEDFGVVREVDQFTEPGQVRESEQFTEPEPKNSDSEGRLGELNQIPEPSQKLHEQETYEFTEPTPQITEPGDWQFTELGQEINAGAALAPERRLWNLETYGDRHGKRRLRRSLRFVKKPCRVELGQVTPDFESELRNRLGRGRWAASRTDAEFLKRLADSTAKSVKRDKRKSRKRPAVSKKRRPGNTSDGGQPVSPPSGDAQWADVPDVPDVLM
jgi:hypothetical protein